MNALDDRDDGRPDWAPVGIDLDRPSVARVYDYYLGGRHNFAVDREMAGKSFVLAPHGRKAAAHNRGFLRRAVRLCVDAGVRQFLDLGSGIPTVGNVHEVAQRAAPDARVVYVDIDPVAVAHSRAILDGAANTAVLNADLREPERILADPDLRAVLDLDQPTAVLLAAVLHFVPDGDDPAGLLARLRAALAPGSFLVLSHATSEGQPPEIQRIVEMYRNTPNPLTLRGRADVEPLFAGFDLLDPGVVWASQWRPEPTDEPDGPPEEAAIYAGVGRLR